MYEHKSRPLLKRWRFVQRLLIHGVAAFLLMFVSLLIGVVGYHRIGGLGWVDSILNASMILGGMGPVDPLQSNAAKLFAAFYALFSGVVFLVVVGIMIAPMAHRLLHYLHLDEDDAQAHEDRLSQLVSKS